MAPDKMRRILIFDDDPYAPLLMRRALRRSRYPLDLEFAEDDQEAIAALGRTRFDMVLCDNRIPPFIDYRETVPLLIKAGYTGPIVVFSANPSDRCFTERAAFGVAAVVDRSELDGVKLDALIDMLCIRAA